MVFSIDHYFRWTEDPGIRLVGLVRRVQPCGFYRSPDFEAWWTKIRLMLSVSVTTRTESLVNKSSPTCSLLSLMELWLSDLLNSYEFGCVTIKFIWSPLRLCNILMYPTPPPTAHTHNHFVGSQFAIFPTFYSVSNDWSPLHSP